MRRFMVLCMTVGVISVLFGCGGNPVENVAELERDSGLELDTDSSSIMEEEDIAGGILPTRIEEIDKGGTIPEGCEAKYTTDDTDYRLEMLWGTWVPETGELPDTDKTIMLGEGDGVVEVVCWPEKLTFVPAWAGVERNPFMSLEITPIGYSPGAWGRTLAAGLRIGEEWNLKKFGCNGVELYNTDAVGDPLGMALEARGYGLGQIIFKTCEKLKEDVDTSNMSYKELAEHVSHTFATISYVTDYERKIAYAIHRNILAVGITDAESDMDVEETDITEIDYAMSWTGYRLTLTYNGESVVYVPVQMPEIELEHAGPVTDTDRVDGIYGITLSANRPEERIAPEGFKITYFGDHIMHDLHDGYVDATCYLGEDGILTIESDYSDSCTYSYLYSGDSLTLVSDKKYVYSMYTYELESPLCDAVCKVDVGEETFKLSGTERLEDFIGKGFTVDYDLTQAMVSCQVSELLSLHYNGSSMDIKVVNPYEKPIPLSECLVCAIYIKDESGEMSIDGHWTEIGRTTYDEVDFFYKPAYEKRHDMLRYKGYTNLLSVIHMYLGGEVRPIISGGDTEVIYDFQDGILTGYRIEIPALLYNGLQDNVDASILANMKPAEFSGMVEVRDTVLDRLKSSFQDASVNVNINDTTGEIVLDNNILFGFDETALSDVGKQYIDDFMGIYASVVTDSEFSGYIDKVLFEGHTDSNGTYNYNLALSEARAAAVLDYCLTSENNGMSAEQREILGQLSSVVGHAFTDLIYDEKGEEDADASRRVTVKFYIRA